MLKRKVYTAGTAHMVFWPAEASSLRLAVEREAGRDPGFRAFPGLRKDFSNGCTIIPKKSIPIGFAHVTIFFFFFLSCVFFVTEQYIFNTCWRNVCQLTSVHHQGVLRKHFPSQGMCDHTLEVVL